MIGLGYYYYPGQIAKAICPGYDVKLHPLSREIFAPCEVIAPIAKRAIISCTPIMNNSPLGDLFTIAVCEKIAPPLFGREKFAPTTAIY